MYFEALLMINYIFGKLTFLKPFVLISTSHFFVLTPLNNADYRPIIYFVCSVCNELVYKDPKKCHQYTE